MLKSSLYSLVLSIFFATSTFAQTAESRFTEADRLREQGQFRESLAALEQIQQTSPDDADVLWRLSRIKVDLGEVAEGDEQEDYYVDAMRDAEAAVEADPENPESHMALAISAGRVALISGSKRKVELSRVVKESVDRTIELDPNHGIAHHVRARWNYEVADLGFFERTLVKVVYGGLPEASFEQAIADFKRAIQLDDSVLNHLELGKTYLKVDDPEAARAEFQKAIEMPAEDPDDPTHQAEARTLLEKTR